ncbi:MAG TPA: hypothetical protein VGK23_05985 [Methanomassiliicoccales archaeon]
MKSKNVKIFLMALLLELALFLVSFRLLEDGIVFWYFSAGLALHISLTITAAITAILIYNRRSDRIGTELDPDDVAGLIQEHLGGIGYSVGWTDQKVTVLLDHDRNVRIEVRETEKGSELLAYPALTTDGLGSMVSYGIILPFCGLVAIWMSIRSIGKTEQFSSNVLRPTLMYLEAREKAKPKGSERQEVGSVITTTLKKANHLATEAFLALNASYADSKWTFPLVGFIAYAALFFTLALARDINAPWPSYYSFFLEFMLVAFVAIVVLSLIWLRLRFRQESNEVNKRIGELQAAISREEGTVMVADGDEAALETLLNVCPDLPRWTKYRSRNFYLRNPGTATVLGWSMFLLFMVWSAFSSAGFGLPAAIIFIIALASLYLITKWRNIRSDRRTLEQWRSRIGTLREDIEKKLQEL